MEDTNATNLSEPAPTQAQHFKVLGVRIDAVQIQDAIPRLEKWIQERNGSHFVAVTGMHGVMEAHDDPQFKKVLNRADMVVPDGMSMVWVGRFRHRFPLKRRCYGPDLMAAFCRETGGQYRHFLYGGTPGVAQRLAQVLREQYGVRVVGSYTPPFRALTPEEDVEVIAAIQVAKPDVLWVGLSTPKQERWIAEHMGKVDVPAMLGTGAAFDFLTSSKRSAPRWMGDHGLEWLYRFLSEPRRLWRRVLIQGPRFVLYVSLETLGLLDFDDLATSSS